ncbi:MAG: inositol monophosphatase family protein [Bacteroidia bacterium]
MVLAGQISSSCLKIFNLISTFSLALTQHGQPIVGAVYDPFMERLFYAAKGGGAFLNDKQIHVSDKADLKDALIDEEGLRDSTNPVISTGDVYIQALLDKGARPLKF